MDNLKTFLDSVMHQNGAATMPKTRANNEPAEQGQVAQASQKKQLNAPAVHQSLQYFNTGRRQFDHQSISNAGGLAAGAGRSRTDSESSVASDISSVSADPSAGVGVNGAQVKRKDSEPYFWIM